MPPKFSAPRGTQDFFPPESAKWQALEAHIHALARRYGYGEVRTPIFEPTELFVRGVGEATDIVEKEMYTFDDRGGRSMTLRPEFTAPVVRAIVEHNLLSSGSLRLYYTGPIFRYERPQAGRFRQSHQFGIECAGYAAAQADAEVMALGWDLFSQYKMAGVQLLLNSIGDENCRPEYREALRKHFEPYRTKLSADSQRRLDQNVLRLLDSKASEDKAVVDSAPRITDYLCKECAAHFDAVQTTLRLMDVPFTVEPRIVRGLDYYTRTVFEFVSDALGAQNAICAGGRYDRLIKSLGGSDTPAVGFALGMERFLMAAAGAQAERESSREGVQAIALGDRALERLIPLVARLRRENELAVFIDYAKRNVLAQLKIADRNLARYALILGDEELAKNEITVRDLITRTERRIPLEGDLGAVFMEGKA